MEALAELHPLVVHFPIVLFITYSVLEILGIFSKDSSISNFAYIILIVAMATALLAVLTGNQASQVGEKLFEGDFNIPKSVIDQHELFATITVWFFLFVLIARTYLVIKKKFMGRIRYIFIIFALVGMYYIYRTSDLGGKLVYEHGVGTELTTPSENGKTE